MKQILETDRETDHTTPNPSQCQQNMMVRRSLPSCLLSPSSGLQVTHLKGAPSLRALLLTLTVAV